MRRTGFQGSAGSTVLSTFSRRSKDEASNSFGAGSYPHGSGSGAGSNEPDWQVRQEVGGSRQLGSCPAAQRTETGTRCPSAADQANERSNPEQRSTDSTIAAESATEPDGNYAGAKEGGRGCDSEFKV